MVELFPIDSPFSLDELAERIRKSSNFRFAWQFFAFDRFNPQTPNGVRQALETIIELPECHRFLRDSFEDMYDPSFEIAPLHEHCMIVKAGRTFEDTLASAANDHLGAYSRTLRSATGKEIESIRETFSAPDEYYAFQLIPGTIPSCETCGKWNHHLFTNWFYGVAWDWCFLVTWPKTKIFWLGCLTDTD